MKVEIIDASSLRAMPKLPVTPKNLAIIESCFIRSEERWIGTVDGKIACLWGLIPPTILSWSAYIWLYHNGLIEDHKFLFIRHSQLQMKRMLTLYPKIAGDCVITNATGRKWLEWLGASFGPPEGPLVPFTIRAKHG
jgi:hypothetical protein